MSLLQLNFLHSDNLQDNEEYYVYRDSIINYRNTIIETFKQGTSFIPKQDVDDQSTRHALNATINTHLTKLKLQSVLIRYHDNTYRFANNNELIKFQSTQEFSTTGVDVSKSPEDNIGYFVDRLIKNYDEDYDLEGDLSKHKQSLFEGLQKIFQGIRHGELFNYTLSIDQYLYEYFIDHFSIELLQEYNSIDIINDIKEYASHIDSVSGKLPQYLYNTLWTISQRLNESTQNQHQLGKRAQQLFDTLIDLSKQVPDEVLADTKQTEESTRDYFDFLHQTIIKGFSPFEQMRCSDLLQMLEDNFIFFAMKQGGNNIPSGSTDQSTHNDDSDTDIITDLEHKLEIALENEEYETAATIRDEINKRDRQKK